MNKYYCGRYHLNVDQKNLTVNVVLRCWTNTGMGVITQICTRTISNSKFWMKMMTKWQCVYKYNKENLMMVNIFQGYWPKIYVDSNPVYFDWDKNNLDCYDAWNVFARHCENGSSQIQGICFDLSYSPVAHYEYFRINIAIADMHRLTTRILDVSNAF